MLDAAGILGKTDFLGGTTGGAWRAKWAISTRCFRAMNPTGSLSCAAAGDAEDLRASPTHGGSHPVEVTLSAAVPLRHRPHYRATVEGIAQIAEAGVLDVISLGADQDAQEHFFSPAQQDPRSKGAGGVPFRTEDDLLRLYAASRLGNYPLVRSYSGTADHLLYADLLIRTIQNAWCATSLFWFNTMDGRVPAAQTIIREHQDLMHWHGERIFRSRVTSPITGDARRAGCGVASAFYAHNAKRFGVRDILTYMFQSPPISNAMTWRAAWSSSN
jgi:hypothetical protein